MKRIELSAGVERVSFCADEGDCLQPVLFSAGGMEFLRQTACRFSPRPVYRLNDSADAGEVRQTANGEVALLAESGKQLKRMSRSVRLAFAYPVEQVLTGLGQHEDGVFDYAGKKELLYQHNMKIPIPFLLSSEGWGLLIEADCAMRFFGEGNGFAFELDAADTFSYVVIHGVDCADVLRKLSLFSGKPAMLPKWAFGYIQSRERYKTADELVETVREFRRRGLGLDCIVLDWMSWQDGCWGDKTPDPTRFPDVKALTDTLHGMSARLMVSVWPNVLKGQDHDEFAASGMFLPGSKIYDAFSSRARDVYWQQCRRHWMSGGADALWCDSCEPITDPDWCGSEKRGDEERFRLLTQAASEIMDPAVMNAYAAEHLRGLREHWLEDVPGKRPLMLARSGGINSSALGAILWSGDVSATWSVLEKQVTEGIKMASSGIAYWTLDIGAFFVSRQEPWFWRGDYPEGVDDPAYRELYVRWFQYGAMLPVFRSHGTDTPREPWAFGDESSSEYRILKTMIRLRYRLLPYIYASAAQSCRDGLPMMRAMMTAFGEDIRLRAAHDSYMLGDALLVRPVVRSLSEGGGQTMLTLPGGSGWYDLFSLRYIDGGQVINVHTPLDRFPLFARAGSILPVARDAVCTRDLPLPARELWVFCGADGAFELYDDEGDGHGYLSGEFVSIPLAYDENDHTLTIGRAEGKLKVDCKMQVRFVRPNGSQYVTDVCYQGNELHAVCPETPAMPCMLLDEARS